ncbi:hypothetical protein [Bacillus massiliglaciei]|uniref:hypothetical protein n=1 Tax=Bacillus massiliglaciei TaxID=1816693 RepID=UPI000DA63274|nr:hypothetical protein [Bacillus massiliglaciei]
MQNISSKALCLHLAGRQLLRSEIPFPDDSLDSEFITKTKGIIRKKTGFFCERCGNQDRHLFYSFPCQICGKEACTYCRACIMMGRVSECSFLYGWKGPKTEFPILEEVMAWTGELSDGQQTASNRVVKAVEKGEQLLVWAV